MKRIKIRKLEKDKGSLKRIKEGASRASLRSAPSAPGCLKGSLKRIKGRLGGLASLGPLGARLLEGNFEANFSYGYEKLEEESARSAEQI